MRSIRRRTLTRMAGACFVAAAVLVVGGCSSASNEAAPAVSVTPSPSPSASLTPPPTPSVSPSPPPSPSPSQSPSPAPKPVVAPKPAAKPAPRSPLLVEQLATVQGATQVVIVTAANYTTTHAVLRTYEKRADGWHKVFGDMPAHLGRTGFAPHNTRHQGDGSTPSGIFKLGFMFGTKKDPGVHFEYRPVTENTWWVGDYSTTAMNAGIYNTWSDGPTKNGVTFDQDPSEHMKYFPGYIYGQVIEFNMNPTVAGRGSAIFLHYSSSGGPTAGCVSLTEPDLLKVLRWLRPEHHPVIVMAPDSDIRKF